MPTDLVEAQEKTEPRDQNIAVRCTRSEKQAVQLVTAFDSTTESDTLRSFTLEQVVERAELIRSGKATPRNVAA